MMIMMSMFDDCTQPSYSRNDEVKGKGLQQRKGAKL
jgi:hypothetical protein